MKPTFLNYCNALSGFVFYDKNYKEQPKYLLYWQGYSPDEVLAKFYKTERPKEPEAIM